jgi:hypothetical protein
VWAGHVLNGGGWWKLKDAKFSRRMGCDLGGLEVQDVDPLPPKPMSAKFAVVTIGEAGGGSASLPVPAGLVG